MTVRQSLLLIPGLLCDQALWQNQINSLKDIADCSVADTSGSNTIASMARLILGKAPPQFALAGLSMGGYVAFEIIRQAKERVLKLAVFDSTARADTDEQKARRRLLMAMSRAGKFKGVTPRLLPSLIHSDRLSDKTLTTLIITMAENVGRETFLNQQQAILDRADSRALLPTITCPTLVVGGRQDAITPPESLQEIASGIKGSRLEIIENCGHLSSLEQPDAVSLLMRSWLKA